MTVRPDSDRFWEISCLGRGRFLAFLAGFTRFWTEVGHIWMDRDPREPRGEGSIDGKGGFDYVGRRSIFMGRVLLAFGRRLRAFGGMLTTFR